MFFLATSDKILIEIQIAENNNNINNNNNNDLFELQFRW